MEHQFRNGWRPVELFAEYARLNPYDPIKGGVDIYCNSCVNGSRIVENMWYREQNHMWQNINTAIGGECVIAWRLPLSEAGPFDELSTDPAEVSKYTSWFKSETYQRRVVAAANRFPCGFLAIGVRHGCPTMRKHMVERGYKNFVGAEQGFIDNRGEFMNRQEAWKVAVAAGQILHLCGGESLDGGSLFSENVW